MGRARRAMELIHLSEVEGLALSGEREKFVLAAREVLQEEFNDVRLVWRERRANPRAEFRGTRGPRVVHELVAKGPGGDRDHCGWLAFHPELAEDIK